MSEVTRILHAAEQGDPTAIEELLPLVYDELRRLAAYRMAKIPPGQTLQATALVHEAYLRLVGSESTRWDNRGHFLAAAAESMRRILVDQARRKGRLKRGGDLQRLDLEDISVAIETDPVRILAVNEALEQFSHEDPAKADLVKLRFFVGMTLEEAAQALGLSKATAKRHWAYAKAWLYEALSEDD